MRSNIETPVKLEREKDGCVEACGPLEWDGETEVTVTVTITQPLTLLGLAGLGSQTVTGQATARAAHGVEEAAP